ncbi:MAG: hypothetical protein GF411_14475 [Candidatus Lokiarchaeota archaeon]|nr:hypothetical protein [Candidatus Lokiarchaeota archaeon]
MDAMGVPMHYKANGKHWFNRIGKPKDRSWDPDPEQAFKGTVIFGEVEGDQMPSADDLDEWLDRRAEPLAKRFKEVMHEFGTTRMEPDSVPEEAVVSTC